MIGMSEIINIYRKANEIDFSVYDPDFSIKLNEDDFRFLKSGFEYGPKPPENTGSETSDFSQMMENADYYSYNAGVTTPLDESIINKEKKFLKPFMLLRYYFFYLAKNSDGFTDQREIRETIGRSLTDLGISKNEKLFYDISRTYWTLKALLHNIFLNGSSDEIKFSNAVQLLIELDIGLGSYFYPTDVLSAPSSLTGVIPPEEQELLRKMQIPDSVRLRETQNLLRMTGIYNEDEIKQIIKQNPRLHSDKSGCFIATAVFDSVNAKEVMILRQWRDEIILKTKFGEIIVKNYYQYSPPIAKIIGRNSVLKSTAKAIIKCFIKIIYNR